MSTKLQNKSEILTLRISPETKGDLEFVSKFSRRTKSFLVEEVVAQFAEFEAWKAREINKAVKEAEKGEFISHEKVGKWLEKMIKTGKKVKHPKPDVFIKK